MSQTPRPSNALAPPRQASIRTAALFVAVFICGAALGASLAVVTVHRTLRQAARQPELRTRRAAQWIGRRLRLDTKQKARIGAILKEQASELEQLRGEVWPRVLARLDATERQIDQALYPAQRERWNRITSRLRRNWLGAQRGPPR